MQHSLMRGFIALIVLGTGAQVLLEQGFARADPSPQIAQEQSPGNSMRDMMREMMRGRVPPPGMTADRLPDPESEGASLVMRFCQQCHDLPSPRFKTQEEWPAVFARMLERMRMMSTGSDMGGRGMMEMHIRAPTSDQAESLLKYLQRYGMQAATEEELRRGAVADRRVFEAVCAQCHVLPSPALHPSKEWPGVAARMVTNMNAMARRIPTTIQLEAVVRFLQKAAFPQSSVTRSVP